MPQPTMSYWATHLFADPAMRPKPVAPVRTLPTRAARRFKRAREALLRLKSVTEQVVFMGNTWKWVWMFEIGGRKLVYLHPVRRGVSATFVVTPSEISSFRGEDLPPVVREAVAHGQEAGLQRWCWMELSDMATVDALIEVAELKHRLLAAPVT